MKVVKKQRNSRMCIMCGLDNEAGVRAPFYTMEDGSVMTLFRYRGIHQSFPGRVHGGLISTMLDEMGLRALWAQEGEERTYGVTMSLDTSFRKPVPYDEDLLGRGVIVKNSSKFFVTEAAIMSLSGEVLANGTVKYIKLPVEAIAANASQHEEMCYLIQDGVTEIAYEPGVRRHG